MPEKIPQHGHCSQCGKAFIGEGRFCTEDCSRKSSANLSKRKKQLLLLYVITFIVLVVALIAVA